MVYRSGAFTILGVAIIGKVSKPYDTSNIFESVTKEKVNLLEMLKSVFQNKLTVVVSLGNVIRYIGFFTFFYLLIYVCDSVVGSIYAYSIAMVISSVAGIIGAMLSPVIIKMVGGRKKAASIMTICYGLCFVALGIFGQTFWGLMITYTIATILQYAYDTIDMMMYLDAGEYYYNKTGRDTRAYCMNVANIVGKIAQALSAIALGAVLVGVNYTEGIILDAAGKTTLTMAAGISAGVPAMIYGVLLILFRRVSDAELTRCINENAEKDAAL